jgi:hypothetical protein
VQAASILDVGCGCGHLERLAVRPDLYKAGDGATSGYFRLECVETAWDVQVLCHMSCGNALADVLEAAACRLRVLARKRLDLANDSSVVTQDIVRKTVRNVGMRRGSASLRAVIPKSLPGPRPAGGPPALEGGPP